MSINETSLCVRGRGVQWEVSHGEKQFYGRYGDHFTIYGRTTGIGFMDWMMSVLPYLYKWSHTQQNCIILQKTE